MCALFSLEILQAGAVKGLTTKSKHFLKETCFSLNNNKKGKLYMVTPVDQVYISMLLSTYSYTYSK